VIATQVISNAGLLNTYNHLLPPDVVAANPAMQQQLQQATAAGSSMSTAVLYVGLDEPWVPEFEGCGTLRVFPSADHDGNLRRFMEDPEAPLPVVEICCCDGSSASGPAAAAAAAAAAASGGGGGAGGPYTSTLQVISFANYDWFREWAGSEWHKRGEDYAAFKHHMEARLMQKLGEHTSIKALYV
jgi:all-trans-retinol 13,14-reductase